MPKLEEVQPKQKVSFKVTIPYTVVKATARAVWRTVAGWFANR